MPHMYSKVDRVINGAILEDKKEIILVDPVLKVFIFATERK